MADIFPLGEIVLDWTPEPEKYQNDNIHPCVRYIQGGFAGHEWWMVATPYAGSNSRIENPILYYGDSEADGSPPLTWYGGVVVEQEPGLNDTPPNERGYNSDACIHFDGTKLWVFWRVNGSAELVDAGREYDYSGGRATFGRSTTDGINFSERKLFAVLGWNTDPGLSYPDRNGDAEMCPIVLERNGEVLLYGALYQYSPKNYPYGFAKWKLSAADLDTGVFIDPISIGQLFERGFDLWHFDMFEHDEKYYCVASPQSGNSIILGVSLDGDNFTFYNNPLITSEESGGVYFYKPSAIVHNDIFYMWYPNRKNNGESTPAYIMMNTMPFSELLKKLEDTTTIFKKV